MIDRITKKLDEWKKAFLSLRARIILIQSCLAHISSGSVMLNFFFQDFSIDNYND